MPYILLRNIVTINMCHETSINLVPTTYFYITCIINHSLILLIPSFIWLTFQYRE